MALTRNEKIAYDALMVTTSDRIKFVLDFANAELKQLGPEEWKRLRAGLDAFVSRAGSLEDQGGVLISPEDHEAGGVVTGFGVQRYFMQDDEMLTLQEETRLLVRQFTATEDEAQATGPPLIDLEISVGGWPYRLYAHWPMATKEQPLSIARGPLRDTFLLRLWLLLKDATIAARLMRCPQCATPFYRLHKQRFCNRRCAVRAAQKRFRETDIGKVRRREQARQRYRQRKQRAEAQRKASRRRRAKER